jgi:hypothetical protein
MQLHRVLVWCVLLSPMIPSIQAQDLDETEKLLADLTGGRGVHPAPPPAGR